MINYSIIKCATPNVSAFYVALEYSFCFVSYIFLLVVVFMFSHSSIPV